MVRRPCCSAATFILLLKIAALFTIFLFLGSWARQSYPPFVMLYRSLGFMAIILGAAEYCGR